MGIQMGAGAQALRMERELGTGLGDLGGDRGQRARHRKRRS